MKTFPTDRMAVWSLLAAVILLGGCAKDPEPVVRERAQTYTNLFLAEKYDEAVNCVDPDVVAQKGRTTITNNLTQVRGLLKVLEQISNRKLAGFEIRRVDFDNDKTHAALQVVAFSTDANGGDRKEHPLDQKWVLKKGAWYVILP